MSRWFRIDFVEGEWFSKEYEPTPQALRCCFVGRVRSSSPRPNVRSRDCLTARRSRGSAVEIYSAARLKEFARNNEESLIAPVRKAVMCRVFVYNR